MRPCHSSLDTLDTLDTLETQRFILFVCWLVGWQQTATNCHDELVNCQFNLKVLWHYCFLQLPVYFVFRHFFYFFIFVWASRCAMPRRLSFLSHHNLDRITGCKKAQVLHLQPFCPLFSLSFPAVSAWIAKCVPSLVLIRQKPKTLCCAALVTQPLVYLTNAKYF